ncbi:putative membrane protein YkvI [Salsuginibacillus halophilus]|uniref:Putative membrane protein YkvI n=1 Tax=Salsuginibacillus halophilus TaxID=517424 RepID=A0A2P8HI85_9BACI|nr:hypothetical protein [Salsuginibacillus halophilus]PSL45928.1 putative membrane protein YkvI [Salsuginibacillus halophilus]
MLGAGLKWMFLIIGTMIGAGYASGREIWQFFGAESTLSIVLFTLLFSISCFVMMSVGQRLKTTDYRAVLTYFVGRRLGMFYDGLIVMYLFTTTGTMIAGGGSALEMLHVPYWAGIFFMAVLLVYLFRWDVEGVTAVNVLLIPILILTLCVTLFLFQYSRGGAFTMDWMAQSNWSSAFTFTSLNLLPVLAVLAAVGSRIRHRGEIWIASLGSGAVLGGVSFLYNESLLVVADDVLLYEIPLFAILNTYPYAMVLFMTVLLWTAIFTTAATGTFGLVSRFRGYVQAPPWFTAVLLLLCMLPLAGIGFSTLIAVLYPFYGIMNLYLLGAVLLMPLLRRT